MRELQDGIFIQSMLLTALVSALLIATSLWDNPQALSNNSSAILLSLLSLLFFSWRPSLRPALAWIVCVFFLVQMANTVLTWPLREAASGALFLPLVTLFGTLVGGGRLGLFAFAVTGWLTAAFLGRIRLEGGLDPRLAAYFVGGHLAFSLTTLVFWYFARSLAARHEALEQIAEDEASRRSLLLARLAHEFEGPLVPLKSGIRDWSEAQSEVDRLTVSVKAARRELEGWPGAPAADGDPAASLDSLRRRFFLALQWMVPPIALLLHLKMVFAGEARGLWLSSLGFVLGSLLIALVATRLGPRWKWMYRGFMVLVILMLGLESAWYGRAVMAPSQLFLPALLLNLALMEGPFVALAALALELGWFVWYFLGPLRDAPMERELMAGLMIASVGVALGGILVWSRLRFLVERLIEGSRIQEARSRERERLARLLVHDLSEPLVVALGAMDEGRADGRSPNAADAELMRGCARRLEACLAAAGEGRS